jgi:hypothetical protein
MDHQRQVLGHHYAVAHSIAHGQPISWRTINKNRHAAHANILDADAVDNPVFESESRLSPRVVEPASRVRARVGRPRASATSRWPSQLQKALCRSDYVHAIAMIAIVAMVVMCGTAFLVYFTK